MIYDYEYTEEELADMANYDEDDNPENSVRCITENEKFAFYCSEEGKFIRRSKTSSNRVYLRVCKRGKDGYVRINGKYQKASDIMLDTFHMAVPDGYEIRFRDGNVTNCSLYNMYCCKADSHRRKSGREGAGGIFGSDSHHFGCKNKDVNAKLILCEFFLTADYNRQMGIVICGSGRINCRLGITACSFG